MFKVKIRYVQRYLRVLTVAQMQEIKQIKIKAQTTPTQIKSGEINQELLNLNKDIEHEVRRVEIQISRGEDWYPINRFNQPPFLCLS
jgi:hypothetical protein